MKPNNKHRELYLTDAVAVLASKGEAVLAQVAADSREVLGCNTRADLAEVDRIFRDWKRLALTETQVRDPVLNLTVIDKYDRRTRTTHPSVETEALSQQVTR